MKKMTAFALLTVAASALLPETSYAQSACEIYRVKKGDSLRGITKKAYGNNDFRVIYDANRDEVGRNPNIIEVGIVLRLPCADGSLPGKQEKAPTLAEMAPDAISFVTANGYLPYTDESLPRQGIFTTLVERAMLRADPEQEYTVTFVNDWAAHLEALLPSMAFDASFPWTQPACENSVKLTQYEAKGCETYIYSAPFYEIVEVFFAQNGSGYDSTVDFVDLEGANICRPEGYPTTHLAELYLLPPVTKLTQPERISDCFDMLMAGEVDVVALDSRAGSHAAEAMGISEVVSENPNLNNIVSLQIAVHRENPNAEKLIEMLNRGLLNMHQSGEWRDLIAEGLQSEIQVQAGSVMN